MLNEYTFAICLNVKIWTISFAMKSYNVGVIEVTMGFRRFYAKSVLVKKEGRAVSVPVARTFSSRLRGLMGRASLGEEEGLFLSNCSRVHCCFMRFPIDVLYLDSNLRGIEVETLFPWQLGKRVKGACHVLEMSAGYFDGIVPSSVQLIEK